MKTSGKTDRVDRVIDGAINIGLSMLASAGAVVSTADGPEAFKRPFVLIALGGAFLMALKTERSGRKTPAEIDEQVARLVDRELEKRADNPPGGGGGG